jgi:hypothetical protein
LPEPSAVLSFVHHSAIAPHISPDAVPQPLPEVTLETDHVRVFVKFHSVPRLDAHDPVAVIFFVPKFVVLDPLPVIFIVQPTAFVNDFPVLLVEPAFAVAGVFRPGPFVVKVPVLVPKAALAILETLIPGT